MTRFWQLRFERIVGQGGDAKRPSRAMRAAAIQQVPQASTEETHDIPGEPAWERLEANRTDRGFSPEPIPRLATRSSWGDRIAAR